MHVKAWILDESLLLTGSVNLTHNGLENNKEYLFKISSPGIVREVLTDFNQMWELAEIVTQAHIADMQQRWDAKAQRKKTNINHGRSQSVPRDLSEELLAAAADEADVSRLWAEG